MFYPLLLPLCALRIFFHFCFSFLLKFATLFFCYSILLFLLSPLPFQLCLCRLFCLFHPHRSKSSSPCILLGGFPSLFLHLSLQNFLLSLHFYPSLLRFFSLLSQSRFRLHPFLLLFFMHFFCLFFRHHLSFSLLLFLHFLPPIFLFQLSLLHLPPLCLQLFHLLLGAQLLLTLKFCLLFLSPFFQLPSLFFFLLFLLHFLLILPPYLVHLYLVRKALLYLLLLPRFQRLTLSLLSFQHCTIQFPSFTSTYVA
mmetsp:Transcript_42785/g.110325  ORF Transcript_42785/g.110325 Transcript_42785/m.110325 type:complete len:253 (-) Transcript_42785:362-1120(-)